MSTTLRHTQKHTRPSNPSEVADFVIRYGEGLYTAMHRPMIQEFIEKHMGYGTLFVVKKNSEIVAVTRWNWVDRHTANILDMVIRPDYRKKNVMKSMLVEASLAYPYLKRLKFHRKKHNRNVDCLVKKFIGGN